MAKSQGVICRPSLRIALVALLVIVPNSFAAPRQISPNPGVCAPSCKSSQDVKLRYEGGKTYIYDFVSESVTRIIGSSDESSDLKVKGQVVLEAQSQCDFVLTVKDATVQNPNGKVSGMETLTGSSIRFAYQDGTVEELCVGENDPTWSANIKRGLVSMLQNQALKNMGKSVIVEADVSGRCPTQYVVEGDRYVKSRDLLGCSNREDSKLLHHGIRYDLPSRTKSLPVASSNMSCVQDMREGVVQTVSCKESHMLNAFKQNENGAQTTVISTLVLQSVQSGSFKRSSVNYVPSSIFYDHSDTLQGNIARNGVSQTRAVLDALCKDMEASSFSSEAPDYFLQLKKAISFVTYDDLREIYDSLDSGNLCRQYSKTLKKMLVDAAVQSGSDGPIALVFNLFDNVEENIKKSFYAQVTFAPRPGPQALDAVSKVLKKQSTPEVAVMLAASGMAHQYCKNTNADCVHNQEYIELVGILARHASSYCLSADSSEVEKAIGALQALGNLDALTSEAVAAIRQCMTGNDRVQVRALDASRRDPCNPTLKQNAKDIFANVRKASNVRIQGYIAMTRCMEPADVETIQSVMDKEKSNQVISYVASHIRNKIRSAKPDKPEVYAMFPEVRFPRSVPQDLFKYSKNLEQSFMSRANDFGGSLDGNIIYSPTSYMPRSASANATIFALGRAFNFLEVGIYAENFESAFERFYKSRGSDRSSRYVWGGKRSNYLRSTSGDQSPPLYNIDSEMEPIWEQSGTTPRVSSVGYGDIYVRVHGTSILVSTLKENQLSGNTLWAKAPLAHSSRNPADIKFTESASVDEEIVYPTITGMPLKFGVALSSVVDLEVSSTTSSATFFDQGSRGSTFRAHVVPRAASLIRGRMSIAAGPYESGVQLEGKVHSTTGVDLDITNQKNTFDFKLAFPENKVHLTELRNELFWVQTQPDEVEKKTPVKTNAEKV